jgi:hypothetical protein
MTITLEDVVTSNAWGYLHDAQCLGCRTNQEIWVQSTINTEWGYCLNCLMGTLYDAYRYSDNLITEEAVMAIRDSRPRPTENTCYSCEGIDDLIPTWNGVGAEVHVHDNRECSRSCERCDTQYPRYNFRVKSFYSGDLSMPQFDKVLGEEICDKCQTEVYADNGGVDNFFHCVGCDSLEIVDDSGYFNGTRYCNFCYDNNVYTCDECSQEYWDGDGHYCEEEDNGSPYINSYSYKPRPFFFGTATYHMGFELEVESDGNSRRDGAEIVVNSLGERVYLKEDGSLNDGFEIVTHPHSLEEYQTKFDWESLGKLRRLGFRSWNTSTCGLHVHVSRTAFGNPNTRQDIVKVQAHELRFMKLIYDNDRQISRLAGRTSNYATFGDKGRLVEKIKYGTQHNGRYSAINSDNSATLEVRVFRGSLKPERVLMALELVQCSVEYTRGLHVNASNKALSWMMFTRYVADNASTYPHLFSAMEKSFMSDSIDEDN